MKREWCVLVLVAFLFIATGLTSAFSGGNGSLVNPYQITNCTELNETRNYLTANFSLGNDINMSAVGCEAFQTGGGWAPIGNGVNNFTGNFNGNNHIINDLYINRPTEDYVGLFGFVGKHYGTPSYYSIIKNTGLINVNIVGRNYVGGLVGQFDNGEISNSYTTGTVVGNNNYVGGLIGNAESDSLVSNSFSSVNVTGGNYIGGLIGFASTVRVVNTYSIGIVTNTTGTNIGGLVSGTVGTFTSSYWDTESSGIITNKRGIGKTTAEMKSASTYIAWDFDKIWEINSSINNGYPYFKNLYNWTDNYTLETLSGNGVDGDAYIIMTCNELQNVENDLAAYYELGNNINCSNYSYDGDEYGFLPIGYDVTPLTSSYDGTPFSGNFDGKGYKISDLYINRIATSYIGLFAYVSGNVSNVSLENVKISGAGYTGGLIGGIDSLASNMISNSYSLGEIIGQSNVGGLIGEASSRDTTIYNSYSSGTVLGDSYVGGLGGFLDIGNMSNCYSTGYVYGNSYGSNINGGSDSVGGLVGEFWGSLMSDSYSTVEVHGYGNIGGLVGHHEYSSVPFDSVITNCYSTGNLFVDSSSAGGLIGSMAAGYLYKSYSTGNVNGIETDTLGGLVGVATSGSLISNSYATGNVNGSIQVGGLIGNLADAGTILSNSYATGNVIGSVNNVGGLVSLVGPGATISDSYSTGNVSGTLVSIGGLIGTNGGAVSNSYWYNSTENSGLNCSDIVEGSCFAIDDLNYFYNYDNVPMNLTSADGWDFVSIWNSSRNGTDYPILQWQQTLDSDTTYPQFSVYGDNNATLNNSGIGIFNITVLNTNGTVLLEINGTNITATNLSANVYNVSLSLDEGTYSYKWYSWGNGSTHNPNVSATRSYVVNATPETVEETFTSSSYFTKTYFSDVKFSTEGNKFNLKYTDKIKFVVRSVNHTLTMQRFNSTTARVYIQSNPITTYLQKGISYEFDLNNDSVKDVRVRYDGINKTSAMVFIQGIVPLKTESPVVNNTENVPNEVRNETEEPVVSVSKQSNLYWLIPIILISLLFIVYLIFIRRINEHFKMKRLQRSVRYSSKHYYLASF